MNNKTVRDILSILADICIIVFALGWIIRDIVSGLGLCH